MEERTPTPLHKPPPARRVLNQPPSPPSRSFSWTNILFFVAILGALGWAMWERTQRNQQPEALIVAIADTTPPTASFDDDLPPVASQGMMSLTQGDCQTAAARFRTAHRSRPDLQRLQLLEGAALICAGEPREAHAVLSELSTAEAPPRQVWWYLAQSCLLLGDTHCAIPALNQCVSEDRKHRRQAEEQRQQLDAAREQLQ